MRRDNNNMVKVKIEKYDDSLSEKWDKFVLHNSYNGTFLQTRNFLNYHPKERFDDYSLVVYRGETEILAVIPACVVYDDGQKTFSSHPGGTFGGIVFNKQFYNIQHVEKVLTSLENYLKNESFKKVILKQTSQIFCDKQNDLMEYFFFQRDWRHYSEISFVIDFREYLDEIPANFVESRRRGFRHSEKKGLKFRKLSLNEIEDFYSILSENLKKFEAKPVHTLAELKEFKSSRLKEIVEFYGSFYEDRLLAASMVFCFGTKVFHTQYLAASQEDLKFFPNNNMDTHLIMEAKERGFRYFSFGISTEENGTILNEKLALFKEGFGTSYCNNKVWYKTL